MGEPSAHWARIEQLLPQALDIPPPRREEFLRVQCRDDPTLLAELVALVRASEQPGDFLHKPVVLSANAPAPEDSLPPGTVLGAWKVGDPIGHGGMGQVYAAERADGQFEMSAALKVLKRGLDTDALLQRFVRERQILARLSHPNIARLLDAGATPDGRPYFVMERVQGQPITAYCAGLDVRVILQLVSQACQAVSAAHRERIVHRDLKPSNLLVTESGELKLLDFGIAKALAEDEHQLTMTDARMLTPSYAAPEQILGQPVSVLSDVYALGVILFELLTGQLPHRREGLPLPVLAAELTRETATRPSVALLHTGEDAPAERQQQRAAEIAGDLDHIVLKAMHADPQRRYASALDLSDDLHRFLEHRPVLARPDSLRYRAQRFVQRHPVPVAAGGVATLALIVGFAVALWQAQLARAEAQRAEENLATATAVSDFVTQDLLASVDPDKRSTANITLKEMLETAAGQVDKRFAARPQVAAELHYALGISYGSLGLNDEKRAQETAATDLYTRLQGPDAEPTLKARYEQGLAVKRLGDLPGALKIQQDVYQRWVALGQAERPEALLARLETATLKEAIGGSLADTIAETRAIIAAVQRTKAPDDLDRLAKFTLADALKETAQFADAEAQYRLLLASLEQHPATRFLMHPRMEASLADVLIVEGKYDEADRVLAALEAELTKLVPPTHDQFLNLHLRYARLRTEQARFDEAELHTRPLLQSKGLLWPLTARVILSEVQMRQGRAAEAVQTADRLMRELKELIPPDDSSFVEVSALLGEALTLAGRPRDAAQALDIATPALPHLPPRHTMLAQYRRAQGLLALSQGDRAAARAALAESLSIYDSRLGHDHWRTKRVRDELAHIPTA